MTKGKWFFLALVITFIAVVFVADAKAQFQPCVWPRTCGS